MNQNHEKKKPTLAGNFVSKFFKKKGFFSAEKQYEFQPVSNEVENQSIYAAGRTYLGRGKPALSCLPASFRHSSFQLEGPKTTVPLRKYWGVQWSSVSQLGGHLDSAG